MKDRLIGLPSHSDQFSAEQADVGLRVIELVCRPMRAKAGAFGLQKIAKLLLAKPLCCELDILRSNVGSRNEVWGRWG